MSAPDLGADDFAAFFHAVHGVDPFPWQQRLLDRLIEDKIANDNVWPDVLDLPTGAGKTAAIDIAVFHLALEASRGQPRRAPVRIAFVVDRRLIVDDAYDRAQRVACALHWSLLDADKATALEARLAGQDRTDLIGLFRRIRAEPVMAHVATRLAWLAGRKEQPLLARRLRGGMPREDDWARTPVQPTVLCSTVDQVGSRLLFRGYGVSHRMKPVHAGLLGSDCLILLDEAHLAEPFRQTLAAVKRLRRPDDAPWEVALLTATPGIKAEHPFCLSDEDRHHPLLSCRLTAAKPARLIEIPGQGGDAEGRRVEAILKEVKATLATLRGSGIVNPAIGVVVNRVLRARAVFERLQSEPGDCAVTLIIGPARPIDRENRGDELDRIRTGACRSLEKPLIVIATQTIEVGVDIDLDGLVTEAAALDALRQRFGRLNRAGREIAPVSMILAGKEDIGAKADDPIYGDRTAKTWEALHALTGSAGETVDFGVEALAGRLRVEQIAELAAPTKDAPILLPAYADLWSHTSPIPNADPEVALFLHGPERAPASVQIVWRADIAEREVRSASEKTERDRLAALLTLAPPRAAEAIEIPLWAARAWLREEGEPLTSLSDIAERAPDHDSPARGRPAFRYAGADDVKTGPVFAGEIRPGDLLVVPAEYGGCDEWGWNPGSRKAVEDLAETAAWHHASRRFAVRVTSDLALQGILRERPGDAPPDLHEIQDRLSAVLAANSNEDGVLLADVLCKLDWLPERMRKYLGALHRHKARLLRPQFAAYAYDDEERPRGVVLVAPFGVKDVPEAGDAAAPATESDDLGSIAGHAQPLDEHSREVKDQAADFAGRAGLPESVAADIALAAYLHDAGKLDPRFQAYLSGGDPFGWDDRKVLAKSGRSSLPPAAWERAGLPPNWRHEALSVRLAQRHPRFAEAHDPAFVLWLVGVHHGFGRPFFPHADPLDEKPRNDLPRALDTCWSLDPGAGPQSLAYDFEGRDWPQIFEDLKQSYGIWGLARLEGFVRLADHRASEAARHRYAEEATR